VSTSSPHQLRLPVPAAHLGDSGAQRGPARRDEATWPSSYAAGRNSLHNPWPTACAGRSARCSRRSAAGSRESTNCSPGDGGTPGSTTSPASTASTVLRTSRAERLAGAQKVMASPAAGTALEPALPAALHGGAARPGRPGRRGDRAGDSAQQSARVPMARALGLRLVSEAALPTAGASRPLAARRRGLLPHRGDSRRWPPPAGRCCVSPGRGSSSVATAATMRSRAIDIHDRGRHIARRGRRGRRPETSSWPRPSRPGRSAPGLTQHRPAGGGTGAISAV